MFLINSNFIASEEIRILEIKETSNNQNLKVISSNERQTSAVKEETSRTEIIRKKPQIEQKTTKEIIPKSVPGFSPNIEMDFSNYYHYQPTAPSFHITQDENEKEMRGMKVLFEKGYLDLDKYEINDILGSGYLETTEGTLIYEIIVSNKYSSTYVLDYKIASSTSPLYNVGDTESFGQLKQGSNENISFSTETMFEDRDSNNVTDTIQHLIFIEDGTFRNLEPGIFEIEKRSMAYDYEMYSETENIEIIEFTFSYCSLIHGMFEVAHNSNIGDENYDGRLDFYEDETINIQDLAIFASNYEDEFWCAYQITPL